MLQLPVEDVISKINEETGLSKDEINKQIEAKLQKLDGLVSKDGAAYIIASELGVRLFKDLSGGGGTLKIKNILVGMNNVDAVGKIKRIFDPRHFEKNGKKGKVVSFILADETGTIRTVLWNDMVDLVENSKITTGDTIKILGAYTKENPYSGKEIHLGTRSKLIQNPEEDVDVPVDSVELSTLSEIKPDNQYRMMGVVVQTFIPYFYKICPTCRKKAIKKDDLYECKEHGTVEPDDGMLFSFVLDDGTDCLRCVSFGKRAENLCGTDTKDAIFISENKDESILKSKIDQHLLGKNIEIQGTARENKVFERLEILTNQSNINVSAKVLARQMLKGN